MSFAQKAASSVATAFKAAVSVVFGGRIGWGWTVMPGTRFDYAAAVADGRGNAIVMACVLWLCRTFPEAPIRILRQKGAEWEPLPAHEMTALLERPNPYYSGTLLWFATIADWAFGNAYWLKVRSQGSRVVELYWLPAHLIEPRWPESGAEYLSHYDYTPNQGDRPIRIDPADVVHFRYGLDPKNIRKGLSPLGSLLREVFTDDEASNFTAALLRNLGVPGVIISPQSADVNLTPDDAEKVKASFKSKFGGDNRGEPMVMRGPTSVNVLSFSPQQMDMKGLRRIPEERVSAIFGTPAVVVGLGAGLDRSTFANFAEAREAAYESNVIPTQRLLAAELQTQLLPDFGDATKLKVDFDLSRVRVLQPDQDALHTRVRENFKAGLYTLNQALGMLGQQAADQDFRMIPISSTPTAPEDVLAPLPEPMPAQPALDGQQVPPKVLALPRGRKYGPQDEPFGICRECRSTLIEEEARDFGGLCFGCADGIPVVPYSQQRQGRKARKGASEVGAAIERLRRRLQAPMERDVKRFLKDQQGRVLARMGQGSKDAADPLDFDPGTLLPDSETELLRKVLENWYGRTLNGTHSLVQDALGLSFDLDDPTTRAYLAQAGVNITAISQTTLDAIRRELQAGQAEGEGVSQLAARIRDLPEFDSPRARTVARTELANASNLAAVTSYRASDVVVGVRVMDGDYDEACASMDGRVFSLDEADSIDPIQHPNCLRAFAPIVDEAELEDAA